MVRCPYCRCDVPKADIKSHYESCVTRLVQFKDSSAIPMRTDILDGSEEENRERKGEKICDYKDSTPSGLE